MIVDDIRLAVTRESDPYWVTSDHESQSCCAKDQCRFRCARYPPMIVAFFYSIWKCMVILISYALGCRSTYRVPSDEELNDIFYHQWPFTDLLLPAAILPQHIQADVKESDCNTVQVFDATVMRQLQNDQQHNDLFTEQTTTWFVQRKIHSILIDNRIVTPRDPSWPLAKLFAMQNAHYMIKFSRHGYIHFPQEAFFAITRHCFPDPEHVFRKLLAPHEEFADIVNYGVLQGDNSVLNSGQGACCCWDAQTTDRQHIQHLVREGAKRLPPLYGKSPTPALQPFYQVIYRLCCTVVSEWKKGTDKNPDAIYQRSQTIQQWSRLMHDYLSYPYVESPTVEFVATVFADVIFKVSVWHSSEHYGFTRPVLDIQPMRIRSPFRDAQAQQAQHLQMPASWSSHHVVSVWDRMKQEMYCHMFVCWWNNRLYYDTRLDHVVYPFEADSDVLRAAGQEFRRQLQMVGELQNLVPLHRISKSIEW
jgi:hypothetical protein